MWAVFLGAFAPLREIVFFFFFAPFCGNCLVKVMRRRRRGDLE